MNRATLTIFGMALFCFAANAATVNVTVANFSFTPKNVTVNIGDKVVWTFTGGTHTTTSGEPCTPDGKWDSGDMSSGTYEFTFTAAGVYPYFCKPHCSAGMTGTVTVSSGTTDIKPVVIPAFNVYSYPNPAAGSFTISIVAPKNGQASVSILSTEGKTVFNEMKAVSTGQNNIPVNINLPAGIYLTRINLDGIVAENRMMINR